MANKKKFDTFKQVENLESQVYQRQHAIHKWHLEVRNSDNLGTIFGTDSFYGTEQEALTDAKNWLKECLTLTPVRKEILVINAETDECIYQGNFNLIPEKLEVGNYIAVVFQAETSDTSVCQFTEYGTVISIDNDIIRIADELDLTGKPSKDSQLFEFAFSTHHVVLFST